MAVYVRIRRLFLDDQTCDVGICSNPAVDVHHVRGRVGTLLLDTRFWAPVCRRCHDEIQTKPEAARQAGLVAPLGQWGAPMGDELADALGRLPGARGKVRAAWVEFLAWRVPCLGSVWQSELDRMLKDYSI